MTHTHVEVIPKEKYVPSEKEKHRARHLFREMIKQSVRESVRHGESTSETIIRNALRERAKLNHIARARGIKPGSRRWDALFRHKRRGRL